MSYCTTLTAINSLMSGTYIALLNVSQMSKVKSTKLTCAEGQVSNCFFFLPLVPSSKICKDNYSIKYVCQRQASLPVRTVNSESGELCIAPSFAMILYAEHVTSLGMGREHTVPITPHAYSNRTAAVPCTAQTPSLLDLSSSGQTQQLTFLTVACLLDPLKYR